MIPRRALITAMATLELTNRDDLPIRANLHLPAGDGPHPLVLVAHGFKGFMDWGFFPHLAEELARGGLAALRLNFARNGIGDDPQAFDRLDLFEENSITRELADLEDLLSALPGLPEFAAADLGRLGLFGHSRGGAVSVLFASREPRIKSLVTWAAVCEFGRHFPPDFLAAWREAGVHHVENARTKQLMPLGVELLRDLTDRKARLDVAAAAAGLTVPHLIVHGTEDAAVPAEDGRRLLSASGGGARLLEVEGAGHTMGAVHPFAGPTDHLDRAVHATVEHFLASL